MTNDIIIDLGNNTKVNNKKTTLCVLVDRSASMGFRTRMQDAIDGANLVVEELKNDVTDIIKIAFDDRIEEVNSFDTLYPRSNTDIFGAITYVLNKTHDSDKILIHVYTDGDDNCGNAYKCKKIFDEMRHKIEIQLVGSISNFVVNTLELSKKEINAFNVDGGKEEYTKSITRSVAYFKTKL